VGIVSSTASKEEEEKAYAAPTVFRLEFGAFPALTGWVYLWSAYGAHRGDKEPLDSWGALL
jgi:hypothetical protein